ncbi:MAG: hypothetical protein KGZ39_01755 [Simkania sp.]|nr:hypothetical protein [Simkania sp.]
MTRHSQKLTKTAFNNRTLSMSSVTSLIDYRPEAKLLDSHGIPTLDFVSKSFASAARRWLKANTPQAHIQEMPAKHLMFWEYPDLFNQYLDTFLDGSHTIPVNENTRVEKEKV